MIYSQTIDLTTMNKILKINKIYILTLTIPLKMITPIRKTQPNNKINLKTITIMSLLPKNLQFQHNPSQTGTSTSVHTQSIRVPTRVVNQRQTTHSPQSHLATSPNRSITFNLPHTDDIHEETHDTLQDDILTTSSAQNTSVNVASPTRTNPDYTRYITRSRFDPPSIPSAFRSNISTSSNNIFNDNPQTSNRYYDPFNYNFYPPSNTTNHTNTNQHHSQINTISTTQNPFIQLSNTNTSQNIYSQNQGPRILPLLILILHRILKEDFIILHLHIYQLILSIKRIQIQILTLILTHYHQIQSNIYLHHSHNN